MSSEAAKSSDEEHLGAVYVNYVEDDGTSPRFGPDGQALLPVRSRAMLRRLARVADLHSVKLVRASLAHTHSRMIEAVSPLDGMVAATCDTLMQPAQIYARLTGRHSERTRVGQPLGEACEVVMLLSKQWTSAAADWLEQEAQSRAAGLGILIAPDAETMLDIAACRAVALAGRSAAKLRAVTLFATEAPVSRLTSPSIDMYGAKAEPAMLRRALAQANDLLFLHAHADGFDARLGSQAVLCAFPLADTPLEAPGRAACLARGVCHRIEDMPRARAWKTGRLIGPRAIQGRIIVLETCSGMPVASAHTDPAESLGFAVLRSASFGVLVASIEVHLSTSEARLELLEAMRCGSRIGPALYAVNRSDLARQTGRSLFLFGDPRYGQVNAIPVASRVAA